MNLNQLHDYLNTQQSPGERKTKMTEESKLLTALRQPGINKSLGEMTEGLFSDKKHPFDYVYGLTIGAGLTRCECGLWGDVEDLIKDGVSIPCPHGIPAK